jgi:NADH:ubiquinone oxidoreductase subunit 3 (subunit A)
VNYWLLLPPIAFLVLFVVAWLEYLGLAVFSLGEVWQDAPGKTKSYACGEDVQTNRVRPDYSQFFAFAFFFTIMHVVALVVATVPTGVPSAALLAALYLVASAVGLFILYRR